MNSPLHALHMALLLPGEGWALEGDAQHSPTARWGLSSDRRSREDASTTKRISKTRREEQAAARENAPVKKKRIYKKRKPTHTVRKEEKQALEAEIQALEAKLEAFKLQALVQRGDEDECLRKMETHNSGLRDVVQEQHLVLAKSRAMLMGGVQRPSHMVRPTEMYIHLTADRDERHETLKALRVPKLEYAKRFIEHRSYGLHPTTEYFHEERYETLEGDYCNVRFDRNPLRGVKGGLRAVADALMNAAFNAEIIISETSGNITIREDDDYNEESFSQMRLLTESTHGVLVENNLARFEDMSHVGEVGGQSGAYAIASTDFVDKDDRYPYRPLERIRRDTTSVFLASSYIDRKEMQQDEEEVVVVTRWALTRIRRTDLGISHQTLREMRDLSGKISETFLNCVRETVGLPK